MEAPAYVRNREVVTNFYGRWPSFHDAAVIAYERPAADAPSIGITLHTWRMTSEVDPKGFYVLKDHALVTLRFDQVSNADMDVFRDGNILYGISFGPSQSDGTFQVELDSVMDMSGSFSAGSCSVESLVPCTADGKPA